MHASHRKHSDPFQREGSGGQIFVRKGAEGKVEWGVLSTAAFVLQYHFPSVISPQQEFKRDPSGSLKRENQRGGEGRTRKAPFPLHWRGAYPKSPFPEKSSYCGLMIYMIAYLIRQFISLI